MDLHLQQVLCFHSDRLAPEAPLVQEILQVRRVLVDLKLPDLRYHRILPAALEILMVLHCPVVQEGHWDPVVLRCLQDQAGPTVRLPLTIQTDRKFRVVQLDPVDPADL